MVRRSSIVFAGLIFVLMVSGTALAYTNTLLINTGLSAAGLYCLEYENVSYVDPNVTSHMQVGWGPEKENKFLVSLGRRRYFDGKLFNSVYYGYSSTVYSNLVGVGPDAGFRWTSQNGFSIDIGMSFKAYYDTSSSTISITNKPGLRLSLGMAW